MKEQMLDNTTRIIRMVMRVTDLSSQTVDINFLIGLIEQLQDITQTYLSLQSFAESTVSEIESWTSSFQSDILGCDVEAWEELHKKGISYVEVRLIASQSKDLPKVLSKSVKAIFYSLPSSKGSANLLTERQVLNQVICSLSSANYVEHFFELIEGVISAVETVDDPDIISVLRSLKPSLMKLGKVKETYRKTIELEKVVLVSLMSELSFNCKLSVEDCELVELHELVYGKLKYMLAD